MPKRRKEYGTDFYVPENIVAYTGDLKNNPTVYFIEYGDNGEKTYGHITQDHKYDKFNIGREKIESDPSYELTNEWDNRKGLASNEKLHGQVFHPSRGAHKLVAPEDETVRKELVKAINKYKGIKKMYTEEYVQEQLELITQGPLQQQPDQLVELKNDLKDVTHQLQECYGNEEKYDKQLKDFENILVNVHHAVQKEIKKQEQLSKDQKQKPNLSAFSKTQNESKKLKNNQQEKINNSQKNKKKEKKNQKMSMQ